MIDDLFDRDYQEGREALNTEIAKIAARFAAGFSNAFKVLNRIEYSAPWASTRNHAGCN
ncbi:MAG TPA: hypothetical protein VGU01_13500 [Sphingomicrobium sp.]|nr:hypothetical protein [Sphingomicrobium sp.]